MVIIIPVGIFVIAAIVGITSTYFGNDDNPLEEATENIMEFEAEFLLGLDRDTLDFDLTPDSKELGEVAMMKIRESAYRCPCPLHQQTEMDE